MFPQVAPKFFSTRADGPKNVGKAVADAAGAAAKPAHGQVKPADGKGSITSPVTYAIKIGEVSHKVVVQPA